MSGIEAHRTQLQERHRIVDEEIAAENKRPHPDDALLTQLKRQKLRIKEEIESL